VTDIPDVIVDFMDMTDDHRLWTRVCDVCSDFEPAVGRYAIVGDEDADARVARIENITDDGLLRLEVLPGPIEAYRNVLARA